MCLKDDDEQATERPGGLLAESSRATAGVKSRGLSILSFHCMLFYIKNISRYAEVFYKFSIGCHV